MLGNYCRVCSTFPRAFLFFLLFTISKRDNACYHIICTTKYLFFKYYNSPPTLPPLLSARIRHCSSITPCFIYQDMYARYNVYYIRTARRRPMCTGGPRETAARSIYRNATMAVLYGRSQTFNPTTAAAIPVVGTSLAVAHSPSAISSVRPNRQNDLIYYTIF